MSDEFLAYRLIKSANLTTRNEQLVKATINKLIKIFSDDNEIFNVNFKELHIKQEPTYLAQNYLYDEAVDPNQEEIFVEEYETTQEELHQTLYTQNKNPYCTSKNMR